MAQPEFGIISTTHRRRKGLLLNDQAKALGISAPYLSSIENGHRKLTEEFAIRVANFLNLTGHERDELISSASLGEKTLKLKIERLEEAKMVKLLTANLHCLTEARLRKINQLLSEIDGIEGIGVGNEQKAC